MLSAYGIREKGKKVLLPLAVGDTESIACWKSFFQYMRHRKGVAYCLSLAPSSGNARVNSRNTPQNSSTPKWSQYRVCGGMGSAKRGVSLRVGPVPLPPGTGKVIA